MKKIYSLFVLILLCSNTNSQVFQTNGNQTIQGNLTVNANISFNHQQVNFSANPRTTLNPMSFKLWDNYNNGGPTTYGTIMEIYGRSGHQTSQLYFGGWDNSRIRYREAFYNQNTWSDWVTLLDSKNDVESQGNLKITGNGTHYFSNGNVGIGTSTPSSILQIKKSDASINQDLSNTAALDIWNSSGGSNTGGQINFRSDANAGTAGIGAVIGYLNIGSNASGSVGDLVFGVKSTHTATSVIPAMTIQHGGNVRIGSSATSPSEELLTVFGVIHAKEVRVDLTGSLADYVFSPDYSLMPLHQVEAFVKTNKHLPEIPSAAEVKEKGLSMGEMQNKLLQKIEELTLYVIEQQKQIEQQNAKIVKLENNTKH